MWHDLDSVLAMPCRPLPSEAGGVAEPVHGASDCPTTTPERSAAAYPTIEPGCLYARDLRLCAFEFLPTG